MLISSVDSLVIFALWNAKWSPACMGMKNSDGGWKYERAGKLRICECSESHVAGVI